MPYSNAEIELINKITTQFYKNEQKSFSATRQSAWDGWSLLKPYLEKLFNNKDSVSVLDLGCGNLRFEKFLSENFPDIKFDVLAVDNNIDMADKTGLTKNISCDIKNLDVIDSLINDKELIANKKFDLVVAFGLMHHIPGKDFRQKFFNFAQDCLDGGSTMIVSLWQFMRSNRLRNKAEATTKKLIADNKLMLEQNDYFLPWKDSVSDYRFCHNFTDEEIDSIIHMVKCQLVAQYNCDGGKDKLNRYLIFTKD